MDTCTTLTRRVKHLEIDKIAQALEITKLKRRVKKLEKRNKVKVLKLRRLQKVRTTQRIDSFDDTMMDDVSNQGRMIADMDADADADVVLEKAKEVTDNAKDQDADVQVNVDIQGRTAKFYKIYLDHANKAKEDPAVKRYQALKRKPQTEAQARKNIMLYLKNVVGFKMDYFKGMSYDDIRPIFEAKFNSNVTFLQKTKEKIKEEESRALKRINDTLAEKAAKRQKLDKELILLVERKYTLTRFTLDKMLNAVRLEVEEESEVSLELLRVKKLEKRNKVKVLKLRRLQKVRTTQRIDSFDDTMMDDVSNQGRMIADMDADADVVLEKAKEVTDNAKDQDADVQVNADIQGRTAEIYKIYLDHANKVLSTQEGEFEPTEVQEVVEVTTAKIITEVITVASTTITATDVQVPAAITVAAPTLTAAPRRRTKGVVIRDPEESITTTSIIIHSKSKSKDKGKGILVEEPKPLKKQAQIEQDEKYARELEAEYQALKRKPQTEAQARKNMMLYLKNVVGFKMDYFKGMSYDDIRPIFEAKFNSNITFLQKTKEKIKEEESRALKRLNDTLAEKAAKRQKLDKEVEELERHL
nr:hypothetical protein [Tanacetum cinerariifolium]